MAKQRPLRLRTCLSCGRNFYSRSSLSKYCCVAHQVKEWRARNTATNQELEQLYLTQDQVKQNDKQETPDA